MKKLLNEHLDPIKPRLTKKELALRTGDWYKVYKEEINRYALPLNIDRLMGR